MKTPVTVAALACVLTVGACGVPSDHAARRVSAGAVPLDLSPTTTASTTPPTTSEGRAEVTIYLSRGGGSGGLVAVSRRVTEPASLATALRALLEGPGRDELAAGLVTAINTETRLRSATARREVALVDLSQQFLEVPVQDEVLAVAQVVYTAAGVEGVRAVEFAVDGRVVEVPRDDGALTSEPVTPADYRSLAPGSTASQV